MNDEDWHDCILFTDNDEPVIKRYRTGTNNINIVVRGSMEYMGYPIHSFVDVRTGLPRTYSIAFFDKPSDACIMEQIDQLNPHQI